MTVVGPARRKVRVAKSKPSLLKSRFGLSFMMKGKLVNWLVAAFKFCGGVEWRLAK